ncbi:uncharacterized protein L969DRAFT_92190 [Mixia osmundae IAM 14324]|uniref:Aquaporin n=1 Tax=Mixia osmundae (strain CBS 9802 / IAM 14324 / JCM 22182 / KY 12970) TaxID=764103 RepID=G7DT22_MIXOS|nr:uncharacterized protein L969DRAFT_92190 [Mixia osmundae IAM 14324]KEI42765.1 hypothetical protein L969DRAFT_92190 [Mixia osmundae IAM 14324]GAA93901.1 hypothetical protein E5Q_00547 [Mixia osmundae IAM 14324]
MEVGVADVVREHETPQHHVAQHPAAPAWLVRWETNRPRLLMECAAECIGVFFYVFCGISATASFYTSTVAKVAGFGSILNIALSYAVGIAFGIIVAAPTSGGHLSPCYTIAFVIFKGFPLRKAPFYILSQILGAFIASLFVYGAYKDQLQPIATELRALGAVGEASIYSTAGPAGVFALFPNPESSFGAVALGEIIANAFIAILVFSVLDPSNPFVSFSSAPMLIGLSYFVCIVGFAENGIALNTARDLGGRFVAGIFFGRQSFPAQYSAIAALVNIPATIAGAAVQVFILSDSARPQTVQIPADEVTRVISNKSTGPNNSNHLSSAQNGNGKAHGVNEGAALKGGNMTGYLTAEEKDGFHHEQRN